MAPIDMSKLDENPMGASHSSVPAEQSAFPKVVSCQAMNSKLTGTVESAIDYFVDKKRRGEAEEKREADDANNNGNKSDGSDSADDENFVVNAEEYANKKKELQDLNRDLIEKEKCILRHKNLIQRMGREVRDLKTQVQDPLEVADLCLISVDSGTVQEHSVQNGERPQGVAGAGEQVSRDVPQGMRRPGAQPQGLRPRSEAVLFLVSFTPGRIVDDMETAGGKTYGNATVQSLLKTTETYRRTLSPPAKQYLLFSLLSLEPPRWA